MAKIKIVLTKDMISLISNIHFGEVPVIDEHSQQERITWGIDFDSIYGGSYVFEDIALILGRYDEHIKGTEESPTGMRFEKETEDYFWEIHTYIVDNIGYIEELVHNFCGKGGLKPGTYQCKSNDHIWEYVGE